MQELMTAKTDNNSQMAEETGGKTQTGGRNTLERGAQPSSTDTPIPDLALPEPQPDDAVEPHNDARTTSTPAAKLPVNFDPVAREKGPAGQSPSRLTKRPKQSENATPADQAPPELPSGKPGQFNLDKFRVDEDDYAEHAGGQMMLTTIPVRRPSKESWFRSHPNSNFRFPARVIELKEQGETYLVDRDLWGELDGESTFVRKLLVPVITRQQALLIWPIRLPGPDGRIDDWNGSAMQAAEIATSTWIRLSPNKSLGAYQVIAGPDPQSNVTWPEQSIQQLLEIAFRGKIITSLDHPVLRQLRGQP